MAAEKFAVQIGASSYIPGIIDQRITTNTEVDSVIADGRTTPSMATINGQQPRANFVSLAIARALTLISITTGLKIIAASSNALNLFAYKLDPEGTRASGSVHKKISIIKGIAVPREITLGYQQNATAAFEVFATYDGTNDPVALTENSALPSAPVNDEKFGFHSFVLGTIAFPKCKNFVINPGFTVNPEGGDADIFPTEHLVLSIKPVLTLRGIDQAWWSSSKATLSGLAGTHANSKLYLQKRLNHGTYVPVGTAQHISFTMAGLLNVEEIAMSGDGPGETSLQVTVTDDGTNAMLVANLATAIT